ncbi:MAG: serine/threonine protein kinase [Gemmataceae bacterium]|nr:serine/threonine protein kinase [Gemmataceae bacterium]
MTNSYKIDRRLVPGDPTTELSPGEDHKPTATARTRLALVGESGQHITSEIDGLLRRRLRVASLITLAGFGIFLVRGLLSPQTYAGQTLDLAIHAFVVAVMVAVATTLWSGWQLSLRWLRTLELLLFGSAAAFFLWLQFVVFHNGEVLKLAAGSAEPNAEGKVLRLAAQGHAMRWLLLIVTYGTFIPNTWRRCALVIGLMALTPLVLTVFTCGPCPVMGEHTLPALFDMAIVLGLGAAIAIFGSYKLSELQQEAMAARKLGQYRLVRKLGAGGMGEVYLGEHVLLRRSCAIKLIRPEQAGDRVNLSRFEREVQAMATLTHWNTVEVYDYGHAEDGTFYYAMEYLPGLSLQELVDRHGPLPPERAVHFLRQVCGALAEAHERGLIHRDIKPSNVIACERGGVSDVAKLLDFGLVHGTGLGALGNGSEKLTLQGMILGSPPYMAPEQALGRTDLDARTDVYSLGGVAYFLLTGQAPFLRETAMETLVAHAHEPPVPVRDLRAEVPADLAEVVMRCLEKPPEARYPDADGLEQALAQCACAELWGRHQAKRWWREYAVIAARRSSERELGSVVSGL